MTPPVIPSGPHIGSTGLIQQPGIAEQIAPFLQMLMQKEQLALRKEQLKLDKQELESRLSQQAMEQQQQGQLGQGLLQALLQTESAPAQVNLPGMFGVPGGATMTGLTPIGQAAQKLPPAVVPAFVEQTRDIRLQAAKARNEAQELEQFHAALQTVKPEHRPIVAALKSFKDIGLTLTEEQIKDLYPELHGALQVMTATDLNAITSTMARAGISFGQGRRALGYHQPIPGMDDDLRAPSRLAKPTALEQRASSLNLRMEGEYPTILALVGQEGGLDISGAVLTDLANGKVTVQGVASAASTPEQKQLVGALIRYASADQFLTSGQSTTEKEFHRFLNANVPFKSDDEATRQQKLAAFRRSILASRQQAGNAARPSIVLVETLRLATLQQWNPRIIAALESQLADAKRWEADVRRRNAIFADDSPTDETNLDDRLQTWNEQIDQLPVRP